MTGYEYQLLAMRTMNTNLDFNMTIANAALGMTGEAGEVADLVKKALCQGHDLDILHVEKELGDVMWYIALMCEALGLSLNDVMEKNIQKLKDRYPGGFSEQRSKFREKGDI